MKSIMFLYLRYDKKYLLIIENGQCNKCYQYYNRCNEIE